MESQVMDERSELKRYMQALTPPIELLDTGHLAQTELMDYLRSQLPPDQQSQVSSHLLACAQCLTDFRDLHDFFAPAATEETELSEFETKRLWRQLQSRTIEESTVTSLPTVRQPARWQMPLAAAAGLLLALIPLGLVAYQLNRDKQNLSELVKQTQQENQALSERLAQYQAQTGEQITQAINERERLEKELAQWRQPITPQAQPPQELSPVSQQPRGGTPPTLATLTFTKAREFATLRAGMDAAQTDKNYVLEIFDANNQSRWKLPNIKPTADKEFLITLDSSSLPTGNYRLKIFLSGSATKQLLEEYKFAVKSSIPPATP